jgi:3-ketosteroid 9alpha-monooxygenase subunit A
MKYGGWFKIAFERELEHELTTVRVGDRRLLCVKRPSGIEVFDAVCPHRGADLGVNSRLEGDEVVCGYHAYHISLGQEDGRPLCVRKYRSVVLGGLVFALIGDFEDGEFPSFIAELSKTHHLVPGFQTSIRVAPELVIENAFDAAHFPPVHDVRKITQEKPTVDKGVFTARTTLYVAPSMWQGKDVVDDDSARIEVPLYARAFSPNLTVTAIAPGGDHPHYVIAGAVPQPDGNCTIRLSLALEKQPGDEGPNMSVAELLLQFEKMGLEQDRPVWEALTPMDQNWLAQDATIVDYRRFCDGFRLNGAGR